MSKLPKSGGLASILTDKFFKKLPPRYGYNQILSVSLFNEIFDKLEYKTAFNNEKLKVLHLYPLAGVAPIAFQDYLSPKQQILMDAPPKLVQFYNNIYYPELNKYLEQTKRKDVNIQFETESAYHWSSFPAIFEKYKFSEYSRKSYHKELLLYGNYTNSFGEQLLVQHMNCMGNQNWVEQFGRVKLLAIAKAESCAKFLGAYKGKVKRNRMTIQGEAYSSIKLLAVQDKGTSHFTPTIMSKHNPIIFNSSLGDPKASGECAVIEFTPKNVPEDVDLDVFDYITKALLINRYPLEKSIGLLGFGAEDFFFKEPEFVKMKHKSARDLTTKEYFTLCRLFVDWPFRPKMLLTFEGDEPLD